MSRFKHKYLSTRRWSKVPTVHRLIFLCALSSGHAIAQDDFFGDIDVAVDSEPAVDKDWSLTGWARQKLNYGYRAPDDRFSRSERDWSKVEASAYVRWDWQLADNIAVRVAGEGSADAVYQLKGEKNFTADEVDEFEYRFQWLDVYTEGQLDNQVYFKAGQQIVVWGEAENLRITDLINTQDLFTFGQQDLENLRLPVPALRVNYPLGKFLFDGVITYKAGRDDVAPARDEFDPFIDLRPTGAELSVARPEDEKEYFLRLSGHYRYGDWSVMAAEANQNSLDARELSLTGPMLNTVRFSQDRFQALGANVNITRGSWLGFAEVGRHWDKRLQPAINNLPLYPQGWPEFEQTLSALGLEYNGFRNLTLAGELDYIHTHKHNPQLAADRRQLGYSARARWTAMNDRIQAMAVWTQLPDQGGRVWRFTLDYDWSDSIELGLLWVAYSAEQGAQLFNYRHNDSLQLQFEYSFQH